jgi:hypothetical protein
VDFSCCKEGVRIGQKSIIMFKGACPKDIYEVNVGLDALVSKINATVIPI